MTVAVFTHRRYAPFNVCLSAANKHKKKKKENGNNAVDVFHEVELLHRQCSSQLAGVAVVVVEVQKKTTQM